MPTTKRRVYPDKGPLGRDTFAGASRLPSADRIMRFCCPTQRGESRWSHKGATPSEIDTEFSHVPPFGSLKDYGVQEEQERHLWDLEIRRLLRTSDKRESLLPQARPESLFLQSNESQEALDQLGNLATRVRCALFACVVDDTSFVDRNSAYSISLSFGQYCFRFLDHFFEKDKQNLPGANPRSVPPRAHIREAPTQPTIVESPAISLEIEEEFHYIVDQITSTVAVLAVRVSESEYWLVIVLACLAKLATKIKILNEDFVSKIQGTVSRARHDGLGRFYRARGMDYDFEPYGDLSGLRGSLLDDDDDMEPLSDNIPIAERYSRESSTISTWLAHCIMGALDNLGADRPWWKERNSVNCSALIYQPGLTDTRAAVYQNNHGRISGSSNKLATSFSAVALETVWELGNAIQSTQLAFQNAAGSQSEALNPQTIELFINLESPETDGFGCKNSTVRIGSIMDFIAVQAPLSMADPMIADGFQHTLQTVSALSAFGVNTPLRIQLNGLVTLKTRDSHSAEITGFSCLGKSLLALRRNDILDRKACFSRHESQKQSQNTVLLGARKSREHFRQLTDLWAVEETSVVIKCPSYVILVFCLSTVLVAGGLVCGFLIGEKIPGVDPFNLTMFSWLLGGFTILIAKNIRVSSWTWRDFLSRRVACRSVQEMASVTGLDSQDILVFLLASEGNSILRTSGPFHQVFSREPFNGGFSIDVKPNLQTLLASGIILVSVLTLEGPGLVWLRVVPGFRGRRSVRPSGSRMEDVVCWDPPKIGEKRDGIFISEESFRWIKILGVYNVDGVGFR